MTRSRTFRSIALGAACLLTGCGATYDVTVHNDGSRPIIAELVHDPLLAQPRILGSARMRPGDSDRFYAEGIDPLDPVEIEVRVSGDTQGVPEKLRVPTGANAVVIEDAGVASWTGLRLRIEQTPPDEPAPADP